MMKDIERGIGLAITIIGCILTCSGIGYFLDSTFKTSPLFMIVGVLSGTALAFLYLYRFGTINDKKRIN